MDVKFNCQVPYKVKLIKTHRSYQITDDYANNMRYSTIMGESVYELEIPIPVEKMKKITRRLWTKFKKTVDIVKDFINSVLHGEFLPIPGSCIA